MGDSHYLATRGVLRASEPAAEILSAASRRTHAVCHPERSEAERKTSERNPCGFRGSWHHVTHNCQNQALVGHPRFEIILGGAKQVYSTRRFGSQRANVGLFARRVWHSTRAIRQHRYRFSLLHRVCNHEIAAARLGRLFLFSPEDFSPRGNCGPPPADVDVCVRRTLSMPKLYDHEQTRAACSGIRISRARERANVPTLLPTEPARRKQPIANPYSQIRTN